MNLLQIVKTAGDALITRAVESVEADAGATVDSRVNLRTSEDRIAVCIYDAWSRLHWHSQSSCQRKQGRPVFQGRHHEEES